MAFNFKLDKLLDENNISRNALAREAKVRPNLIYEMYDNKTKRIELETFEKILKTLTELTGKKVSIQDLIEYKYED